MKITHDEFDLLLADYLVFKMAELARSKHDKPAQFGPDSAIYLISKLRAAGWCPEYEAEKMPEFEQYLREHKFALPPKNPKAEWKKYDFTDR